MRRAAAIALIGAASMAGMAVRRIPEEEALNEPGAPGFQPILTPAPLPPSRMTRQQRRWLERKGLS